MKKVLLRLRIIFDVFTKRNIILINCNLDTDDIIADVTCNTKYKLEDDVLVVLAAYNFLSVEKSRSGSVDK